MLGARRYRYFELPASFIAWQIVLRLQYSEEENSCHLRDTLHSNISIQVVKLHVNREFVGRKSVESAVSRIRYSRLRDFCCLALELNATVVEEGDGIIGNQVHFVTTFLSVASSVQESVVYFPSYS